MSHSTPSGTGSRSATSGRRALSGFDRVAPLYPLLERIVYAKRLEAGRDAHLSELRPCNNILLLGEGNGRFLHRLLERNPQTRATVVEISPRMIASARKRLNPAQQARVCWREASVFDVVLSADAFDAVVSHYFFDLFAPAQQRQALCNILPALRSGGLWQDTEFLRSGDSPITTLRNRTLLALSYRFLGALCDFPTRALHCPAAAFTDAGLTLQKETPLFSQIAARLWRK